MRAWTLPSSRTRREAPNRAAGFAKHFANRTGRRSPVTLAIARSGLPLSAPSQFLSRPLEVASVPVVDLTSIQRTRPSFPADLMS